MTEQVRPLILNVDDDPDILAMTEFILSSEGYEVATAGSGKEALEMLSELRPDIILLDSSMPDMDGHGLCLALKASKATCTIPVLFLSGSDETEHKKAAFAAGADDYLVKPVLPPVLLEKIAAHLENRKPSEGTAG